MADSHTPTDDVQVPDEEQNITGLLATHSTRKHLLNFVARTTRLHSVLGHITELPDQEL